MGIYTSFLTDIQRKLSLLQTQHRRDNGPHHAPAQGPGGLEGRLPRVSLGAALGTRIFIGGIWMVLATEKCLGSLDTSISTLFPTIPERAIAPAKSVHASTPVGPPAQKHCRDISGILRQTLSYHPRNIPDEDFQSSSGPKTTNKCNTQLQMIHLMKHNVLKLQHAVQRIHSLQKKTHNKLIDLILASYTSTQILSRRFEGVSSNTCLFLVKTQTTVLMVPKR